MARLIAQYPQMAGEFGSRHRVGECVLDEACLALEDLVTGSMGFGPNGLAEFGSGSRIAGGLGDEGGGELALQDHPHIFGLG